MPGTSIAEKNADALRQMSIKLDEVLQRQKQLEERLAKIAPDSKSASGCTQWIFVPNK